MRLAPADNLWYAVVMKKCSIADCEKKFYAKTFCKSHYERMNKYGDPLGRPSVQADLICKASDCERSAYCNGYCKGHYTRARYGKEIDRPIGWNLREYPFSFTNERGYVIIRRSRNRSEDIAEHRLVMQNLLGRELLPGENVHHKNGVKNDNRPENLELWSTSQPYGQRVVDKIIWAKEILATYGEDESKYEV